MGEQRKLAAIMFTDIVGYTALMSKDEHNALKILKKNRDTLKPLIREFHGEWLKEMGDGSLSIFSSIVDAVNCALRIQKALRKESGFSLRIGIHIGDVVVEDNDVSGMVLMSHPVSRNLPIRAVSVSQGRCMPIYVTSAVSRLSQWVKGI